MACDKSVNETPEIQLDFGQEIQGTYEGNYSSSLTSDAADYTISIVKIDETNVRITIPDFGSFDTGILVSSEDKNVLISNLNETLLSLSYNQDNKRLLFTRTTKTLGGQIAYLNFDGYKK